MILNSKNQIKEKFKEEISDWAISYNIELTSDETLDLINTLIDVLEDNEVGVVNLPDYTEDEDGFYN